MRSAGEVVFRMEITLGVGTEDMREAINNFEISTVSRAIEFVVD